MKAFSQLVGGLIFATFVSLKVTGVSTWSWWWLLFAAPPVIAWALGL